MNATGQGSIWDSRELVRKERRQGCRHTKMGSERASAVIVDEAERPVRGRRRILSMVMAIVVLDRGINVS